MLSSFFYKNFYVYIRNPQFIFFLISLFFLIYHLIVFCLICYEPVTYATVKLVNPQHKELVELYDSLSKINSELSVIKDQQEMIEIETKNDNYKKEESFFIISAAFFLTLTILTILR